MATTATINITSDITDSISFSISETMTMTKADGTIDLEETTGLAQRTFSGNTTQVVLIDVDQVGGLTAGGEIPPGAQSNATEVWDAPAVFSQQFFGDVFFN